MVLLQGVPILFDGSGAHLPPAFPVRDALVDESYLWHTGRNYVRLDPGASHVLRVER